MAKSEPQPGVDQFAVLRRALEEARKRLIQADGRNRLIHTPRDAKRSRSLSIVEASADGVFSQLVRNRVSLTLLPAPDDSETKTRTYANDRTLQTTLTAEGLQKRLLGLYRDAKTLEEEQGVNVLFLAIGFLRWFDSEDSETTREAPLILLPVSLTRSNVRSSFKLSTRDEDISINLPLQERLKEFGISLPLIPENDEWRPAQYFDDVREAISSQRRWTIDDNGIFLGFFSFSKLLMYRDLDPANWPNNELMKHPVLTGLLVDGFPHSGPLFSDDQRLDEIFDPADLLHVVDADASQTLAIQTVRKGRNLIIQGPPGTGKSQTITNIIAAAVYDKKKVLFVAEKMAALDVVHQRLLENGLGDACLELHSRYANKKALIQRVDQTLRNAMTIEQSDKAIERLRKLINILNKNAATLNTPLMPSGVTPYRALGEQVLLLSDGYPAPKITIPDILEWTQEKTNETISCVRHLTEVMSKCGSKLTHAWRGVNSWTLQPADLLRLRDDLKEIARRSNAVYSATVEIARTFGSSDTCKFGDFPKIVQLLQVIAKRPNIGRDMLLSLGRTLDLPRLARTIGAGKRLLQLLQELDGAFLAEAWDTDFSDVRSGLATGTSWLNRLRRPYRSASKKLLAALAIPMPKTPAGRLKLVQALMSGQELRRKVLSDDQYCRNCLGASWKQFHTDFEKLEMGLMWIASLNQMPIEFSLNNCLAFNGDVSKISMFFQELTQQLTEDLERLSRTLELDSTIAFGAKGIDDIFVSAFSTRAREWLERFDEIGDWIDLARADRLAHSAGAGPIADALATGQLNIKQAIGELRFIRAETIWKSAISLSPSLAEIKGDDLYEVVADFQKLEEARRTIISDEIRIRHRALIPTDGPELAIVRHEIAKHKGHLATRRLFEKAPRALTDIKPILLMSPISVSQFLPPGKVEFDLLVMDEASQVRPEDAYGVIARAKQLVIVGDKNQLPPTSFFDRMLDDDDEPDDDEDRNAAVNTTALESILSACEARGMSSRMLTWHYRSRHPSLIEVSNEEFYDNRLFLPPSPKTSRGKIGLVASHVNGSYDRGGKRTNEIEANAVVSAVAKHARENPDLSLGVVTFSISQRDLIENLLEARQREDSVLDKFVSKTSREAMFVKNLENVQGDERDTIIISIGYGPRIAGSGLDSMHFGPVSSDGGERRLNVLFTRARVRCEVFSSFTSGEIDLARTRGPGSRVLKRFLQFAETGNLDLPLPRGNPDSEFEEAVGRYIGQLGYLYDFQVGSAGFKIDLAVKKPDRPGEYILAVECDGATYHSARWARERDRLRQQVLEDHGWHFHRIWSTDWFHSPDRAKARLIEAIEAAKLRTS